MLFILYSSVSYSQTQDCLSYTYASYGSINFTDTQYTVKQFINPITNSSKISYKKTASSAISDVKYPPANNFDELCNADVTDGKVHCDLIDSNLTYVVYYPVSINGKTTKGCLFPAIILFHGGGFDDCKKPDIGDSTLGGIGAIAQEFAKRGYVAYVVEYRTGRYIDPFGYYLTSQQQLAEYRAFQDARGAIRSIIRHQRRSSLDFPNDPYQIDTTRIFLGGNSAGSIIALHSAYYNAAQIAAVFPSVGSSTIAQALGAVDIDYYYGGLNAGVNNDYRPLIKGVFNMWGQMTIPINYYNSATNTYHIQDFWSDYGNTIIPPMIAFHGSKDSTLPIEITKIKFAPNATIFVKDPRTGVVVQVNYTPYNSDTSCLLNSPTPYQLDGVESTFDLIGIGSKGMYDLFHNLAINKKIEVNVDCQMEHGLDADVTCISCGIPPKYPRIRNTNNKCVLCKPFQSNFGTPYTNSKDVQIYMVQRATTYFQTILTNQVTNLHNDMFIECENKRVTSYTSTLPHNAPVTTDNPSSCPAADCSSE